MIVNRSRSTVSAPLSAVPQPLLLAPALAPAGGARPPAPAASFLPALRVALAILAAAGLAGVRPAAAAAAAASAPASPPAASAASADLVPRFVPDGGLLAGRTTIRLEPPAATAVGAGPVVVRFTIDGSEPTAASPAFESPFSILRSTLVRARVFQGGRALGPIVSRAFGLAGSDVAQFSGNLPIVVLQTFGQELEHDTRRLISVDLVAPKDGRARLVDGAAQSLRGEVWWRGKSSLRYLKRSMGLKLRDDAGKSRSVALLDLPADADWVLYAPYPDKTLIRDVLAYDLSRQMGHYAARTRYVEVFLNEGTGRLTMDHYMGVYVLEEKIRRSPSRVNIQKLGTNDTAAPAITGGYIFKKDHGPTYGEPEPTVEGRPNFNGGGGGNAGSRYGYPTGPGGFPADPRGFLPTLGGDRAAATTRERMLRSNRVPFNPGGQPGQPGQPGVPGQNLIEQDWRPAVIERPPGRVVVREGRSIRRGPGGNVFVESTAVEESFVTAGGTEFYYVEPDEKEITPAQRRWLRGHLEEFEKVLYSPDFADPARGYAAYIDVDSFIDYHLIVEVTKNIDGFRFSTYFHKDRGGKIRAQPIWDWNLSFGNANGKQGWMAEHWYWPQLDDDQYSYYRRLFEDPEFAQRYVDRWGRLRATVFSDSNLLARADAHIASIGEARIRNFARWPILGRSIWPNYYVGQTYEDEVRYLKDWARRRLAWIDAQFTPAPRLTATGSGASRQVAISAAKGEVYLTTDGSDPRAPGGRPAPKAVRAVASAPFPAGARLVARAVFEGRWSPPVQLN